MYAFVIRRSSSELIVSDQATMQCLRSGSQEAPMATGARLPLQSTIHRAAVPASNDNSYVLNVRYGRERPPDAPADTTHIPSLAASFRLPTFCHPFMFAAEEVLRPPLRATSPVFPRRIEAREWTGVPGTTGMAAAGGYGWQGSPPASNTASSSTISPSRTRIMACTGIVSPPVRLVATNRTATRSLSTIITSIRSRMSG
jgi:hypothetical protein